MVETISRIRGLANCGNCFRVNCHRAAAEMAWGEILSTDGEGVRLDSAQHDVIDDAGRRFRTKSGRYLTAVVSASAEASPCSEIVKLFWNLPPSCPLVFFGFAFRLLWTLLQTLR